MPHDNYGLILHSSEPRVLLLKGDSGWTLPRHATDEVTEINAAMKEQTGCETTVLYCAYDRYQDDEREEQHRVYALENHTPEVQIRADARWIGLADLATLDLAGADHRAVLEQCSREMEEISPAARRVPWGYRGWFALASQWIREQVALAGLSAVEGITQVKVSCWSTVLRVATTDDLLYFKASAPVFAYEPLLTRRLAEPVPSLMPPVLAIDQERHWMLMRDAGTPLSKHKDLRSDPAVWDEVLRQYARAQIQLIREQKTLLSTGCPDRRLDLLPGLLEEALRDPSLLLLDQANGLSTSAYEQLRMSIPEVRAACSELQSHGIPETLHHDDLHGGNILYSAEGFTFFDWAECAVTHPFCSLVIVERVFRYGLKFPVETIEHLRDCYLEEWTQFEPIERLRGAYALAQYLGKLCRALTWGRLIASLAPAERWEYAASYPFWLQVFAGLEE
ncbi:phosphotransferase [Dictyobacter aurantiacus]|uniref:Aminoglycoside phosphotransferase domain-containing protein n=1 Tax=Dictyobacter aurantiacus TaxID=1936993 RepID=A0A401ZMZ7_9CHLR|nr:phosphotransferase [Dictyobacter aurantiacus]GCE08248.1 hypothetical protein KDAU_55770 [Dictyobacter aurantiacus]